MALTVSFKSIFLKDWRCTVFRLVSETRINHSQLDRKGILEEPEDSQHGKAQGRDLRVLHNKIPGDFNENGLVNSQQRPETPVPVQQISLHIFQTPTLADLRHQTYLRRPLKVLHGNKKINENQGCIQTYQLTLAQQGQLFLRPWQFNEGMLQDFTVNKETIEGWWG